MSLLVFNCPPSFSSLMTPYSSRVLCTLQLHLHVALQHCQYHSWKNSRAVSFSVRDSLLCRSQHNKTVVFLVPPPLLAIQRSPYRPYFPHSLPRPFCHAFLGTRRAPKKVPHAQRRGPIENASSRVAHEQSPPSISPSAHQQHGCAPAMSFIKEHMWFGTSDTVEPQGNRHQHIVSGRTQVTTISIFCALQSLLELGQRGRQFRSA